MSIKRAPRPQSNFYLLSKDISEDTRLSWAARGLLIFLLGKPDHWEVSTAHLIKQTADSSRKSGRDAVRGIMNELIECGYMRREAARGDSGEFKGNNYIVSEIPELKGKNEPEPDSPQTGNPSSAFHPQVSIDVLTSNNISNKNTRSIPEKNGINQAIYPSEHFEKLWKQYPKREGNNPKKPTGQAINARLKEGHTVEELTKGLERYIKFCQAKQKIGTSFVMQAKRFFGTSKEFLEDWEVTSSNDSKDDFLKRHTGFSDRNYGEGLEKNNDGSFKF